MNTKKDSIMKLTFNTETGTGQFIRGDFDMKSRATWTMEQIRFLRQAGLDFEIVYI